MNEFILNNIVLIVMQDMIREVREAVTSLREEVRSELQSFYERISTLIEHSSADPPPPTPPHTATATPPGPGPATTPDSAPAPSAAPATAPGAATTPGASTAPAFASVPSPPPPPPPSYYSPPQAEKEADTPDGTAHVAADTHAPAVDPPTDMVYIF